MGSRAKKKKAYRQEQEKKHAELIKFYGSIIENLKKMAEDLKKDG